MFSGGLDLQTHQVTKGGVQAILLADASLSQFEPGVRQSFPTNVAQHKNKHTSAAFLTGGEYKLT